MPASFMAFCCIAFATVVVCSVVLFVVFRGRRATGNGPKAK